MSVVDIVLASALGKLKRRPAFVVQLLVSAALGVLGLSLGRWLISTVLGYSSCNPSPNLLLIFALTITLVLLGYYVNFWHNLWSRIRKEVPTMFDDVLSNYVEFIETIMNKTFYDLFKERVRDISATKAVLFASLYYLILTSGLYSIDLSVYIISNHRYTLFGYMLREWYYWFIILVLASFVLSQLVQPFAISEESKEIQSTKETIVNAQYFEGFLERFTSFSGLDRVWRHSGTFWGAMLVKFVENTFALPTLMRFERLFVFDIFQIPYLRSKDPKSEAEYFTADIIEKMINENPTGNYRLEPFDKEKCGKPPETDVPLLRRACWYKVYRRRNDEWARIGYAMLLIIVRKNKVRAITRKDLNECIKVLRTRLRGNNRYCYDAIKELVEPYLELDNAIIVLLGNEELLGLRLLLA